MTRSETLARIDRVLSLLASLSKATGQCHPSNQWLSKRTGIPLRSIERYLNKLEAQGKIARLEDKYNPIPNVVRTTRIIVMKSAMETWGVVVQGVRRFVQKAQEAVSPPPPQKPEITPEMEAALKRARASLALIQAAPERLPTVQDARVLSRLNRNYRQHGFASTYTDTHRKIDRMIRNEEMLDARRRRFA